MANHKLFLEWQISVQNKLKEKDFHKDFTVSDTLIFSKLST